MPRKKNEKAADSSIEKLNCLPLFSGLQDDYFEWRAAVIQAVHRAFSGVSSKIGQIKKSFDPKSTSLKYIGQDTTWNDRAYAGLI